MPVTLGQIANNTANVAVAIEGETVNVVYFPGRVTEKVIASVQAFKNLTDETVVAGFVGFNEQLARLISSWDLYEDDAQTKMFPIDAARFPDLPLGFRMSVFYAIIGDLRPEAIAPQTS